MASEHLSLRIPTGTKQRLEELANATGRTKAFLALDAIEKYLEIEAWQISAIKDGLNDIQNKDTVSLKDVKTRWDIK